MGATNCTRGPGGPMRPRQSIRGPWLREGEAWPKSRENRTGISREAWGVTDRILLETSSSRMLTPKFRSGTNPRWRGGPEPAAQNGWRG
eukprot:8556620-Pyramimonas_sp.AAC.1